MASNIEDMMKRVPQQYSAGASEIVDLAKKLAAQGRFPAELLKQTEHEGASGKCKVKPGRDPEGYVVGLYRRSDMTPLVEYGPFLGPKDK